MVGRSSWSFPRPRVRRLVRRSRASRAPSRTVAGRHDLVGSVRSVGGRHDLVGSVRSASVVGVVPSPSFPRTRWPLASVAPAVSDGSGTSVPRRSGSLGFDCVRSRDSHDDARVVAGARRGHRPSVGVRQTPTPPCARRGPGTRAPRQHPSEGRGLTARAAPRSQKSGEPSVRAQAATIGSQQERRSSSESQLRTKQGDLSPLRKPSCKADRPHPVEFSSATYFIYIYIRYSST